eukprot:2995899-Pyramimonas_sp.AAC.1
MYTVPPMDSWVPKFPSVDPSIFLDDFMLGSSNTSIRLLVSDLAQAADSILDLIEEDLDCSVALHKAAVLGSSAD